MRAIASAGSMRSRVKRSPDVVLPIWSALATAVDRYEYTLTVKAKAGGQTIEDRGKGVWVWRRGADQTLNGSITRTSIEREKQLVTG